MQLVESGADPDVRFSAWMAVSRMLTTRASPDRRLQGTGGQRRLRGKAAHRGPTRAAGLVVELSRFVASFGEGAADMLAGVDHVIRLSLAGGVAAIVTEACAFEELRKFPRLSVSQDDGDLDGLFVIHDAQPESVSILRRHAST